MAISASKFGVALASLSSPAGVKSDEIALRGCALMIAIDRNQAVAQRVDARFDGLPAAIGARAGKANCTEQRALRYRAERHILVAG